MPGIMSSQDFSNLFISVGQQYGALSSSNVSKLKDLEDINITDPLVDGQILKYIASTGKWTNVDPQLISASEISGMALRSGDGITTVFVIPHSFGKTPDTVFIEGNSADAEDDFDWVVNESNITITYHFPPPHGTNNLQWYYRVS